MAYRDIMITHHRPSSTRIGVVNMRSELMTTLGHEGLGMTILWTSVIEGLTKSWLFFQPLRLCPCFWLDGLML